MEYLQKLNPNQLQAVTTQSKKVLVVAHSAILRAIHYAINGIPEDGDLLKIEIPNLRIIEYEI